jgi:uncharacterized RDD family membrane protein YckC
MPLQSAPIGQRLLAGLIDGTLVAPQAGFEPFIIESSVPRRRLQVVMMGAGLLFLFWAAYQYLLMVYSGSTPGLRAFRLQVRRFDGNPANRKLGSCALLLICHLAGPWLCLALPRRRRLVLARAGD